MSSAFSGARALFAALAAICVAAVGAALISQHVFNMQPCPWCVLQRLVFVAMAAAALLGLAWPSPIGRRVAAVLVGVLALCGVAAALWQHFVAAKSASCNLTLADRILNASALGDWLPQVFVPYASCADAAVSLLGLPYEAYSGALFLAALLTAISLLLRRGR